MRIANTGETFRCGATRSVLSGMEALARRGIPVGCRGGGCGVCKARVESGSVGVGPMSRAHVSQAEEADGFVLACRAYPRSDLVLVAVGRLARCVGAASPRRSPTFLEGGGAGAASPPTFPSTTST